MSAELAQPKRNRFERVYTSFAERQNKALLAHLLKAQTLRPRLSIGAAFGIGYALLVHLVTLGLLIGGLSLIVNGWPKFFPLVFGGLSLAIVWFIRPTFGRWPQKQVLPRNKYPALYSLVDEIADALHLRHIDGVVIDKQVNASFSRPGLRRRSLLTIGLPLWTILDDQEKVGLIAHEFAHQANGDFTRTWMIGSAIETLHKWYYLLVPSRQRTIYARFGGYVAGSEMLSKLFLYAFSRVPLAARFVMVHLFAQNSRRAEYLADHLASTVSGTEGISGVIRRLQMSGVLVILLNRVKATGKRDPALLNSFRERVRSVTDFDLQRMNKDTQTYVQRLDIDRPPLAYRLEWLRAHPVSEPKVVLSPTQSAQIDQELSGLRERIQKVLLDF